MTQRRLSLALLLAGLTLIAAGLLLWWLAPVDLALHRLLRLGGDQVWARRVAWLSALGGLAAMGPVAIVVAILLAARGRRDDALRLVATIVVGRLLVEGLKLIVQRPRPPVVDRLELVTSWSFPSSHSAGTMMTALAFALLAGGRWPALAAALLVAGVIGWSRVALAVHWPSDVLAGWGLGMMWVGLAIALKAPRRLRQGA
jgi:membrane-associated phospholipid phosphatase